MKRSRKSLKIDELLDLVPWCLRDAIVHFNAMASRAERFRVYIVEVNKILQAVSQKRGKRRSAEFDRECLNQLVAHFRDFRTREHRRKSV